jgi:hypothetical protein
MASLSHLSLTMVPLVIGIMFSQTESLKKAWKKKVEESKEPQSSFMEGLRVPSSN